jgi:UDP-glucose 4-epimerase
MKLLVVGGAGYIGSHMAKWLVRKNHQVVVLDNLSTGFRDAVLYGRLVVGDLGDSSLLDALFAESAFDAVLHFGAFSQVSESLRFPALYYRNNVAHSINLLDAMVKYGVRYCIFSSTAAVFGDAQRMPIDECHPLLPINPYGRSKRMVEEILTDYEDAYGLRWAALRYFNAAGADPEGELGERHIPETHLVPIVLQAASGRREIVQIFGDDYDTPDGTCVRDYIHVHDLCSAHALALSYLVEGGSSRAWNLGNGKGFSVKEIIEAARMVSGRNIPIQVSNRRLGDPAILVADSSQAWQQLGWRPQFADLETIIAHAWDWELKMTRKSSEFPSR